MMIDFMRYELFVSVLFAVGALGAEQLCALYRWPRRFLWAFALAASMVFPLSMALTTRPNVPSIVAAPISVPRPADFRPLTPTTVNPSTDPARPNASMSMAPAARPPRQYSASARHSPDRVLTMGWLTLSIVLLGYYAFLWLRLRRRIALAPAQDLDGIAVRVTDGLGPAVFGLIRPEILVPRWILDARSPLRRLVLAHERQHIAAHDPALLFGALLAVALMPWNLALWWMLRRLRFCVEADCDARVLQITDDPRSYAEALLSVRRHFARSPSASVVLTSSISWLERRVRIMFAGTSRLSRLLAASGSVWALALLGAAVLLHAPGMAAPGERRKLPPADTGPGVEWVRSIARTRFPELFDPAFAGMAKLTMVLNQDGSVVQVREHTYTPHQLPRLDWAKLPEEMGLAMDQSDILYTGEVDIRPSDFERTERPLGYIAYAVLRWPPDPMRTESRVRSAVEAYYPEPASRPRGATMCTDLVAVLMNDDGSVRQAHRKEVGCQVGESFSSDELDRLNDFQVPETELGRGGTADFEAKGRRFWVRYTWPRHADDPPDVVALTRRGYANADAFWLQPHQSQDTQDDVALVARYFPDIEAHGRADLIKTIDGRRYRTIPWILFGRDGHIWQAGQSLAMMNNDGGYGVGLSLMQEIEARFPGIRISGAQLDTLRAQGVLIRSFWISPESPVQRMSDVAFGRPKELLVSADFVQEIPFTRTSTLLHSPLIQSFAHAVDFGVPAGIGFAQSLRDRTGQSDAPLTTRVIATQAGPEAVDLEVQTRVYLTPDLSQPPSDAWVRAATLRVRYGSSGVVDLFGTDTEPPQKVQLVLRPQRLRGRN